MVISAKNAEILVSASRLNKNSFAFANRIGMRLFFVKVASLDIVHLVKVLLVAIRVNSVCQVSAGRKVWSRNVAACWQANVIIRVLKVQFLNVCVLF